MAIGAAPTKSNNYLGLPLDYSHLYPSGRTAATHSNSDTPQPQPRMAEAPKQRLQMLSEQLAKPREDPGMFENIPKIHRVAGDSTGK